MYRRPLRAVVGGSGLPPQIFWLGLVRRAAEEPGEVRHPADWSRWVFGPDGGIDKASIIRGRSGLTRTESWERACLRGMNPGFRQDEPAPSPDPLRARRAPIRASGFVQWRDAVAGRTALEGQSVNDRLEHGLGFAAHLVIGRILDRMVHEDIARAVHPQHSSLGFGSLCELAGGD